jgi:sulfur carrier protein
MRIDVNGCSETTEAATLAELVAERGLDAASVATALDGAFVPRDRRAAIPLTPGAQVEILAPMQGG